MNEYERLDGELFGTSMVELILFVAGISEETPKLKPEPPVKDDARKRFDALGLKFITNQ